MEIRSASRGHSKEYQVAVGLNFLQAFKAGDMDACLEILHPAVTWYPNPKLLETEVMRGREQVRHFLESLHGRFSELAVEPEDGRQQGHFVLLIAVFTGSNPFNGQAVKERQCWVVTVHDNLWTRVVNYPNGPVARLGFEELVKAGENPAPPPPATSGPEPDARWAGGDTLAPEMEAKTVPETAQPEASAAGGLTLEFTLEEADALNRWLLKPAQDGSTAIDDAGVKPALMKIRAAVEHSQAITAVRKELEQAGVPTQHLSDQQVAQLGRRISQAAPRLRPGESQPAAG
jgi:ketosteroid isomerase-like protein